MSRFALLFSVLILALAPEARAARISQPDACGHATRADHVQNCEANRWACATQFGPSSRVQHGLAHCGVSYDQCMSSGSRASASH